MNTGNTTRKRPAATLAPTAAAPAPAVGAVADEGDDDAAWRALEAGHPDLRASGRVPPVVRKAGVPAYEVLYRAGRVHPGGTNAGATFAPPGVFPAEKCRFRFRLWVDEAFPWDGDDPRKVGGKIIGFKIGTGDASGGDYSPTGASFRLTWSYHGGVGPYLYPQVRRAHDTNASGRNIGWDQLDQSPEVRGLAYVAKGVHMFYPGDKKDPAAWGLRLRRGAWNEVEMFCALNAPGKYDGVLAVTINGVTQSVGSVRYRYDDAKIQGVVLGTFFGGGSAAYAPPRDVRNWYADFRFAGA